MLVGPVDQSVHFPDHDFSPGGDNDPSQPVFDGPNGSLQNGNAAVLPDGPESRSDVVLSASTFVSRRGPELASFVTDQMLRCRSCGLDCPTKDSVNFAGGWRMPE